MLTPHARAVFLALFVTFLWSTSWVLIKVGLRDLPALTFAGLRYTLAFLCLLPFALLPAQRAAFGTLTPRRVGVLAVLGLVQYTFTQGAQFLALAELPATTVSLLLAFTPALVALAGGVLLRERLAGGQWFGLGVFLAGALVYFGPGGWPAAQGLGAAIALLGVLANAAQVLLGRAVNARLNLPPLLVTLVSMGVGALALLGAGVARQGWSDLGAPGWRVVAWLAVVNTALAFTLWNHAQRTLRAVEASLINNTMLAQIALLAFFVLGDPLGAREWCGVALALLSVLAVQLARRKDAGSCRTKGAKSAPGPEQKVVGERPRP